jgi:hypothetical protein
MLSTCRLCWIQSVPENLCHIHGCRATLPGSVCPSHFVPLHSYRAAKKTSREIVRVARKRDERGGSQQTNKKESFKRHPTYVESHSDTSHTRVRSKNGTLKNLENKKKKFYDWNGKQNKTKQINLSVTKPIFLFK